MGTDHLYPQKGAKNKGKKKNNHKTNIRQAPFYVQDGDLIGIKVTFLDSNFVVLDIEFSILYLEIFFIYSSRLSPHI